MRRWWWCVCVGGRAGLTGREVWGAACGDGAAWAHTHSRVRCDQARNAVCEGEQADTGFGAMTAAEPLTQWHIDDFHLSRRFVVQQWSFAPKKMKNRIVDHLRSRVSTQQHSLAYRRLHSRSTGKSGCCA